MDPTEPTPRGDPPRHDVVESLREEVQELHDRVEDVVGHALPGRVRPSAGRIAWLVVLSVLAVIVVVAGSFLLWLGRHTEYVAGHLTVVVNRVLADHSDLVLDMRDVRGNPFRSVTVVEPRLRLRGDSGPPLLAARAMTLRYAPWDLAFGRRRSLEVALERPVVRLERGPDGRLSLPRWRAGRRGPVPSREFDVRFSVRDGEVLMPDSSQSVHGWNLDGRALLGATDQVEIARLNWARGPWGTVLQEMRGRVESGDSTRFALDRLRTPDLDLAATGGWRAGARGGFARLDLKRVRWSWLAVVFANRTFDVPGEGGGRFDLRFERGVSGSGTAEAVWDSVPVSARAAFRWADGRLAIGPLTGTSPAGDFAGRVTYTAHDLDVRGHVEHGNPVHWKAIGLPGWPPGDLAGDMHYWSWRGAPGGSRFSGTLGPGTLAGWRADSARVEVDAPSHAPGTFTVAMSRRGGRVTIDAGMDRGQWQGTWTAAAFPLDEWPDGRASGIRGLLGDGRGTVESREGALRVTGALGGRPVDWLGIHAARWSLAGVDGLLLPKPDLALPEIRLEDVMFLGLHFDSARAVVRVGDLTARLDQVTAFAGDTTVTAAGSSRWGPRGWETVLDRAEARSTQFDWTAEGPLDLAGDPRGVTFRRFAARDGAARVELEGRWAVPGGSYDWTGRATALDLHRLGLPLDWDLRGSADADLRVTGPSGDPAWSFGATVRKPGARGHVGDSLGLALSGGPGRVRLEDLTWRLDGGAIGGGLSFDGTARPWPDSLTGTGVERWLETAARWNGRLAATSFPLGRLDRLVPAARGLSGRLDATLDVAGRPGDPVLGVQAVAAPLAWDSLTVDRLTVRGRVVDQPVIAGQRLEVQEVRAESGRGVSTASGAMAVRLALGQPPALPEAPMSWRVDLQNGDLAVLPQLLPQIAGARGRLELHATIAGTPRHPDLSGTAAVRDGSLLVTGRSELIEGIEARFRLGETRITMDSLTARSTVIGGGGRRGTIAASGVVDLRGGRLDHYRFDLGLRDFTAAEEGLYVANFDAPKLVVTDGPRVHGTVLPHVEGDVTLRRAVVLYDFTNQNEAQQLAARTQPLFWTYRIRLLANNDLRWQPPAGDVEFNADLVLEQTAQDFSMYGDVHAIRGTYDFLSNHFTVDQADLTFDNVGGINPVLDIVAETRVQPVGGGTGGGGVLAAAADTRPHTITVTITGRAATPTIEFTSDPSDWDQPMILSQLTVPRLVGGQNLAERVSQAGDPLDSYVTRMINAQLSPLLSRTFMRDVGQWRVEREQGGLLLGQGNVMLTVEHQFNPRVQVSYSQHLPGLDQSLRGPQSVTTAPGTLDQGLLERNVAAEYRINRFFYITTELSQRQRSQVVQQTPELVPEFNVNLKARWEY